MEKIQCDADSWIIKQYLWCCFKTVHFWQPSYVERKFPWSQTIDQLSNCSIRRSSGNWTCSCQWKILGFDNRVNQLALRGRKIGCFCSEANIIEHCCLCVLGWNVLCFWTTILDGKPKLKSQTGICWCRWSCTESRKKGQCWKVFEPRFYW